MFFINKVMHTIFYNNGLILVTSLTGSLAVSTNEPADTNDKLEIWLPDTPGYWEFVFFIMHVCWLATSFFKVG